VNRSRLVTALMVAGFLFLYLPIVLMIAFSFNESRLVTVWGGFSTKWYGELLRNEQVLGAAHQSRARGCAVAKTSRRLSTVTSVYTCVVVTEAWPSSSCTTRTSAPPSSRWVANV